jgi:hypothetical protein
MTKRNMFRIHNNLKIVSGRKQNKVFVINKVI